MCLDASLTMNSINMAIQEELGRKKSLLARAAQVALELKSTPEGDAKENLNEELSNLWIDFVFDPTAPGYYSLALELKETDPGSVKPALWPWLKGLIWWRFLPTAQQNIYLRRWKDTDPTGRWF